MYKGYLLCPQHLSQRKEFAPCLALFLGCSDLPPPNPNKRTLNKKRVQLNLEELESRIVPAIQVNVVGDPLGQLPPNQTTLRMAIKQANLAGGNTTITFATNVAGQTISLASPLPILTANITINNTTGQGIAVAGSGPAQNPYRVFQVAQGSTSFIDSLTISGGFVSGGNGGGILNAGTLTLQDDIVTNNTASTGNGGGICNQGKLNLTDCWVNNNTATPNANGGSGLGGGICNSGGAVSMSGGAASMIKSNQANFGGGIFSAGGKLTILDTQITANTAGGAGGGVYISGGSVSMIGDTLGNNSGVNGGGLYMREAA